MVCLIRRRGALAGVSSVYRAAVQLVGGRTFWVYRSLIDRAAVGQAPEMIRQAFAALQDEFDGAPGSPIGLCIPIAAPEQAGLPSEAEWSEPRAIYAGYLPDGRQLRIAYFKDALIATPASPPTSVAAGTPPVAASLVPSGYRIQPFAEQSSVTAEDAIDLWTREHVLDPEEAERRVAEIQVVATDVQDRLVGVSTVYLRAYDQLRSKLWYTRVFVATAHRKSGLAIALATAARDHLVERYRSGADRRGIGLLFVVENEILKRLFPQAIWPRMQFAFIGEDERGSHVRVHYFPGALAPGPQ